MTKKEFETRKSPWLTLPFFCILGILTVVSFVIPLRPTQSMSEKRNLAEFPTFSVEALTSGNYFDGITLWFSDTFPGRETYLEVASFTGSLYGWSDISIEGDLFMPVPETVPSTMPTEAAEPVQETTADTVAETIEQTTAPTEWGGVKADADADILFSDTVIQIGDSIFSALGFSAVNSDTYIAALNHFADTVEPFGATVISAPPPTAIGIMVEEQFLSKLASSSQEDTLTYLHDGMSDKIVKVDTVSALIPHNSEYIYFRTDHHWTALGAYYAYAAIMESIDLEPVTLDDLEVLEEGTFTGSLYGRANHPNKLKIDSVTAYVPKGDIVNTVYYSMNSTMEYPILADQTQNDPSCKYLVFGTDWPMNLAENRSIPDAPNILVVKDSFGNCMVPFLTQNFHRVYAVDYRKFYDMPLRTMVETYDIDYVLFMPYLMATQSVDGANMISGRCQ